MYRELALSDPRPELVVSGARYDLDRFGMDDGRSDDPDDAFRFVFQLGSGLIIYLYVIQAGSRRDPRHFSHTFWLKDCAAAHVEMEDRGPPASVHAEALSLPLVHGSVTLAEQTFAIESQTFDASHEAGGAQQLRMELALRDRDGATARLSWGRHAAWVIELPGAPGRSIAVGDLLFGTS